MSTTPPPPGGHNPFAPPPRRRRKSEDDQPTSPAANSPYGPPVPQGQSPQGPPPQGQAPQGPYGAAQQVPPGVPPQGPYGAPPQGAQGAPPQAPYGPPPQAPPGAAPWQSGPQSPPPAPPAVPPAPGQYSPPPGAAGPLASHPGQPAQPEPADPGPAATEQQAGEGAGNASRLPGQPVAPPPDAGQAEADGTGAEWRRLHRITPLLNAWKVGVVIFAIALYNSQEFMADLRERFAAAAILGALVALLVVGFVLGLGFGYLAWRRTQYGVSRESLFLHKGVLFRQQRHVRLDRVQAVEVTQPLLARIFGFASVKVESAGGAGSNLMIAFLSEPDAQNLRNELLARSAGVKLGNSGTADATAAGADGSPVAPAAPEREIAEITPGRLIGSLALSFSIALIVLAILGLVAASIAVGNASIVLGALAPMLGAATYFWGRFAGEFNFRAAVSPDGIRLRHGLLETKSRTVPPGRVQAVRISQPPLWRIKDWWRMQVNIAGYGAEEVTGTVLYPAATRAEVAYMLSLVLPDLGDERPLPVLHAGMDGIGDGEGFTTSPRRARWVDPLTWRRTGFRVTGTAILMRTGRWWRNLSVVPHERTQSMGLTQGPIERKMSLATFVVHSTPGPVTPQVHHLDLQVARELLVDQAERSRRARREAGPERWMSPSGDSSAPASAEANRGAYAGVLPGRPLPPAPHDEPAGGPPPPSAPAQPWSTAPPPSAPPAPPGSIPPTTGHPPSPQTPPPGLAPTRPDSRGDHPA